MDGSPSLKIDFGDTQDAQVIHDKLYQAKHILNSNLKIAQETMETMEQDTPTKDPLSPERYSRENSRNFCIQELSMQLARVDTILDRIRAASGLVSDN